MTRRLLVVSLAFHLPLTVLNLQARSFDYFPHLFFADHYRRNWWSLWEPRWYTGFSVASYPPLVHQLIALLSRLIAPSSSASVEEGMRALVIGYAAVQLAALLMFPFAVRAFAKLFVGQRAADRAALLAVALPSLSLSAYAFGQLPTVFASVAGLFALASGGRFVRGGSPADLLKAVLCAGVMAAAHHAVFLLVPFAGAAVAGRILLAEQTPGGRWRALARVVLWATLSAGVAALTLWPFLSWSCGYLPQVPIDHPSRHNFLVDPAARMFFFWPMYGWLIPLLPFLILLAASHRRLALPGGAATALFVLGLGGTTPFPEVLFGPNWDWLTYDRFSFWAGICLLPLTGLAWAIVERRVRKRQWPASRWRGLRTLLAGLVMLVALLSASLSVMAHSQPPALDMRPMVHFLSEGDRSQWRYFTFGFGDQLAKLSILSQATTPDGSYHTARAIPELRRSGIGQIDAALWSAPGVDAAYVFMVQAPRWGVRWAFVNHAGYRNHLMVAGWRFLETLSNGVEVWEFQRVPPRAAEVTPAPPRTSGWATWWWGLTPAALLAAALVVAWWELSARSRDC